MPRDANGEFTLLPGPLAPAVSGAGPVRAEDFNALMQDIAAALSREAVTANSTITLEDAGLILGRLEATVGAFKIISEGASDEARIDISPKPAATYPARVRVFRNTVATGTRAFEVCRGDNTTTIDHQLRAGVGESSTLMRAGGKMGIGLTDPQLTLDLGGTDAIGVVKGTTGQRPSAAVAGRLRYNTTLDVLEVSDGSSFTALESVTMTLGQNSVTVYASGLIHQFGQFGAGNATNPLTGTFPMAFPTACRSVTLTAVAYLGSQPVVCNLGSQPTTTGFTAYRYGLAGQDRDVAVHWDAWGN